MELIESFDNFDNFMVIFLPRANKRTRVRIHFTICSSLTSRFYYRLLSLQQSYQSHSKNRVQIVGPSLRDITFLRRNNKNWDRKREESLQEDRSLKSKNWSGFVCHCEFKHCIYLFLSLHHLFELDFDRILNFKGILEKIFIYLYKLKI